MKNIFIIAPPRSGTNLLRNLLSAHPKISTWPCDEINFVWKYKNINKSDELKTSHINDINKRYIKSFFEKFYNKSNSQYILEKTCANSLRLNFVNKLFPNSFYIFIERNKADILHSILSKSSKNTNLIYMFKKFIYVPNIYKLKYLKGFFFFFIKVNFFNNHKIKYWGPQIKSPKNFSKKNFDYKMAYMINYIYRKIKKDQKKINIKKKITIKYEDLVKNPKKILNKILKKIDKKLLADFNNIDFSKVSKKNIGKGKKYNNFFSN